MILRLNEFQQETEVYKLSVSEKTVIQKGIDAGNCHTMKRWKKKYSLLQILSSDTL